MYVHHVKVAKKCSVTVAQQSAMRVTKSNAIFHFVPHALKTCVPLVLQLRLATVGKEAVVVAVSMNTRASFVRGFFASALLIKQMK